MKTTAILAAFLVISFYSFGLTEVSDKTLHSVEIDPVVPVVLHGFGAHYMYTPKELPMIMRWRNKLCNSGVGSSGYSFATCTVVL